MFRTHDLSQFLNPRPRPPRISNQTVIMNEYVQSISKTMKQMTFFIDFCYSNLIILYLMHFLINLLACNTGLCLLFMAIHKVAYVTLFLTNFDPLRSVILGTNLGPPMYIVRYTSELKNPNDCSTLVYTSELCNESSVKLQWYCI